MFRSIGDAFMGSLGRNPRKGQAEMSQPEPADRAITPELLRTLSALSGIEISAERSEALSLQAEQQLTLMRSLDAIPVGLSEPAGELRLDQELGAS